jgi:hypothetical protein
MGAARAELSLPPLCACPGAASAVRANAKVNMAVNMALLDVVRGGKSGQTKRDGSQMASAAPARAHTVIAWLAMD